MKEFDISIVEILSRQVTVCAENYNQAVEKVSEDWSNQVHVLDSDDFQSVDFAMETSREVDRPLSVLLIQPGKVPVRVALKSSLEAMQQTVGGDIQVTYPFSQQVAVICNENGKIENLPHNRALRDEVGEIYDIIHGDFFIAGMGDESFTSLSEDLMQIFEQRFARPERFAYTNNGIMMMPVSVKRDDQAAKQEVNPCSR